MKTFIVILLSLFLAESVCAQTSTQNTSLKVLSWNIYMLPRFAKFTKKKKRSECIVNKMKESDYDIIVFQEAFMKRARRVLKAGLDKEFPYQTHPLNAKKGSLFKFNGGVWILSRVPIKELKSIQFSSCTELADCAAKKGAVLIEAEKEHKKIHLIATHVQAEDGNDQVRRHQFRQMRKELLEPFKKEGVPTLIVGDLNTPKSDSSNYQQMLDIFQAEDGNLEGDIQQTYIGDLDAETETVKRPNYILDYILIRKNNTKIKKMNRKVVRLTDKIKGKTYNLSDHLGVESEVEW